jgi:hypothetical protein
MMNDTVTEQAIEGALQAARASLDVALALIREKAGNQDGPPVGEDGGRAWARYYCAREAARSLSAPARLRTVEIAQQTDEAIR